MTSTTLCLPKGIRLGVSPLSWTNNVLPDLGDSTPLETCLAEAAQTGYEGVELGRKFPRDVAGLTAALQPHNLNLISGWHSGFLSQRSVEEEWEDALPHVDLLQAMGCKVMVYGECGYAPGDSATLLKDSPSLYQLDLDEYVSRINQFAERLAQKNIRFAFHHHLLQLVETQGELESLLRATGKHVGLVLDTGHAYVAGFHYGDILKHYGDRVFHLHLKDVRKDILDQTVQNKGSLEQGVRQGLFTVPGDGDVDFQDIKRFINSGAYQGWLVIEAEQDPVKAPPVQAVKGARQYLESLFTES